MPSTVEINNNSERLALRRTIESVLASKTARRVAQTAAWHVFKDASLANLQYLQSHNTDEQAFALNFFGKTLPQSAITLAHGKIHMSKKDAEYFTGVDPKYIISPVNASSQALSNNPKYTSPFDVTFPDGISGNIAVYTLEDTPIMLHNMVAGTSSLTHPFSLVLERATQENDHKLVFEMCRLVRTYEPTPIPLSPEAPQIAES